MITINITVPENSGGITININGNCVAKVNEKQKQFTQIPIAKYKAKSWGLDYPIKYIVFYDTGYGIAVYRDGHPQLKTVWRYEDINGSLSWEIVP